MRAEVEDDSPAAPITNKFGHPEVNKQLAGSIAGKFKDDEVHHILPNYFYAKECFHTQITGKIKGGIVISNSFFYLGNIIIIKLMDHPILIARTTLWEMLFNVFKIRLHVQFKNLKNSPDFLT